MMAGNWVPAPRFCSFVLGQETRRPNAAAVSLKLSRQEVASDAELMRRAVNTNMGDSTPLSDRKQQPSPKLHQPLFLSSLPSPPFPPFLPHFFSSLP